jgi:hypothetical protein
MHPLARRRKEEAWEELLFLATWRRQLVTKTMLLASGGDKKEGLFSFLTSAKRNVLVPSQASITCGIQVNYVWELNRVYDLAFLISSGQQAARLRVCHCYHKVGSFGSTLLSSSRRLSREYLVDQLPGARDFLVFGEPSRAASCLCSYHYLWLSLTPHSVDCLDHEIVDAPIFSDLVDQCHQMWQLHW